uniref:Uncharacterized protein n=1 Tax=Cyprinus carpio TaxID=7962 RepID=A0A8C1IZP6_CYPCA
MRNTKIRCRQGLKKYYMPRVKYTAVFIILWACFSAGGPVHQIPTDKSLNLTVSVRNLIMGRGWIFHQDSDPKQTSKSTQKCVTEHKMNLLPWTSQSSEHECGELKRRMM